MKVVGNEQIERPLPTGTVTFLFTDIVGSTPLWEQHPTEMAEALDIHNTILRQVIFACGGQVFLVVGDAFQGVFPTALQALQAAVQAQQRLRETQWNTLGELKVRMGLHTGDAQLDPNGDEYFASHTKNRVARIMSAAHGGQILLSQETNDLVERILPDGVTLKDLGEHHLKGMQRLEHLYQVAAPNLPSEFAPLESDFRPNHNLPLELTPFIGRQREIIQVQELLRTHRLVTLTGSGGVGKTRLSIQVARQMLAETHDGVWFIELAPISDPGLIPPTIAAALGVRGEPGRSIVDVLNQYLNRKALLLVWDNCEHLLEACARLAEALLKNCPQLIIFASSREPMNITGEYTFRVPSLEMPDPQRMPDLQELKEYEAVRLFTERARAVLPTFSVDGQNAPAIAQICQRLDGLPLALELAAARLNLISTEQLASRLDSAFRLLTGGSRTALPRQQTLRATIDWSYELLSTSERVLLRRLAVFAGGGTLEAIEVICKGDGLGGEEILDLLSGLVSKSMVSAEQVPPGEMRYHLLETVRQYALEKLGAVGEIPLMRDRHLMYFEQFSRVIEPKMFIYSLDRQKWIDQVTVNLDNIHAAIQWAYSDQKRVRAGLWIATALGRRFMQSQGRISEARDWLTAGLEAEEQRNGKTSERDIDPESALLRARAYNVLGYLMLTAYDFDAGRHWFDLGVRFSRLSGGLGRAELSWALWGLAFMLAFGYSEKEQARQLVDESVAVARQLGPSRVDQNYLVNALAYKIRIYSFFFPEDDLTVTQIDAYELLALLHKIGAEAYSGAATWGLGMIAMRKGAYDEAYAHFQNALNSFKNAQDRAGTINSYRFLCWLAFTREDYYSAVNYALMYFSGWYTMGVEYKINHALGILAIALTYYCATNQPPHLEKLLSSAVILFSAATSKAERQGIPAFPEEMPPTLQSMDLLREQLTPPTYDLLWIQGQVLSTDDVMNIAISLFERINPSLDPPGR